MTTQAMLAALKVDLGITANAYDTRLTSRLTTASQRITAMGITLQDTESDNDLVIMYAGWLWKSRFTQEPMPRMLQLALNNRVFAQAASEGAST